MRGIEKMVDDDRYGTTYYFCSAGCKKCFDQDPAKHLHPAHGAGG